MEQILIFTYDPILGQRYLGVNNTLLNRMVRTMKMGKVLHKNLRKPIYRRIHRNKKKEAF